MRDRKSLFMWPLVFPFIGGDVTVPPAVVRVGFYPTPPTQRVTPGTARLSWEVVTAEDLAGYRVYYGTTPGMYEQERGAGIDAKLSTELVATGLKSGSLYYFAVTSYDASGNESAFSSEVSKLID